MRLQSAIFMLEDTLLREDGTAREGLDKVLSIFKMESIWLYAVTEKTHAEGEAELKRAGLSDYFRGVLSEDVARCPCDSGTMFERAMKRMLSEKTDTVVLRGGSPPSKTRRMRASARSPFPARRMRPSGRR